MDKYTKFILTIIAVGNGLNFHLFKDGIISQMLLEMKFTKLQFAMSKELSVRKLLATEIGLE